MPRPLRIQFEGALYHVTGRGNNHRLIYIDDRDRELFLSLLGGITQDLGWRCHTFCLMGNHYHLLIETPEPNLALGMCRLNGTYARHFNLRHGRKDHLFGSRYRAVLIEEESHLLEACRYVVLNPVRASLCETAEEWRWSSFRACVGLVPAPRFLEVDWLLSQFGREAIRARDGYAEFVSAGSAAASLSGLLAA